MPTHPTPRAPQDLLSLSIVSHGHGALVRDLLGDIARAGRGVEVLLTLNVPETLPFDPATFDFPLRVIVNAAPKGFGANHNAAFRLARGGRFGVLNPDVRFDSDPFPALLAELADPAAGVVAPAVYSPAGAIEDSARKFPTLGSLARKALAGAPPLDYAVGDRTFSPDWVAGMFMLMRRDAFERARGFDERYFLYYEDVDLCRRLRGLGYDVRLVPGARVTHDARRRSRSNLRHALSHLASMARYLASRLPGPGRP